MYVDIDLQKALIVAWNPTANSFHKKDGGILCTLDHVFFIEYFGLEEKMSVEVDFQYFQEKFEWNARFYTSKVMIHQIPYELKLIGEIPKKVDKMLPIDKFKNYM